MKGNLSNLINNFLMTTENIFTTDDFCLYLRENGFRLPINEMEEVLVNSDIVFEVSEHTFATRAGTFKNAIFSFMPTREEIEKGHFVMGSRGIPYLNPIFTSDVINIYSNGEKLKEDVTEFSMNFLLDCYVLYGEGYDAMNIINDKSNDSSFDLTSPYNLPTKVKQTSWSLKDVKGGSEIEYGDRIICTVKEWASNTIEVEVLKTEENKFVISKNSIERQQWYTDFEDEMIKTIDKYGPTDSISQQLTYAVVDGREKLSFTKNCGAISEFLAHTTKIGFKSYGVENRIWKSNESIPFVGKWNDNDGILELSTRLRTILDPSILSCIVYNDAFEEKYNKNSFASEPLYKNVFPKMSKTLGFSDEQVKSIFLNIENLRDIIETSNYSFEDYAVGDIRKQTITLFANVCVLVSDIVFMVDDLTDYPSEDLIILCQLFNHLLRLLIGFTEGDFTSIADEDVNTMLEGMSDTFEDIGLRIRRRLEMGSKNSFKILSDV